MGSAHESVREALALMMLDSNILIGYLNADSTIREKLRTWREMNTILFISHVSVVEALSHQSLNSSDVLRVETFLNDFIVIPLDMSICRYAGELRRLYKLTVPDALIAASAHANNLPLATRDKKMRSVPGIVLADI